MDEGARLLPAGLRHRAAAGGVPAGPGRVLCDRLCDGGDEAVVNLRALRVVVPEIVKLDTQEDVATLVISGCHGAEVSKYAEEPLGVIARPAEAGIEGRKFRVGIGRIFAAAPRAARLSRSPSLS